MTSALATEYYVAPSGQGISPFVDWNMAATNIQDAVDLAQNPGDIIYVKSGVYSNASQIVISNAPGVTLSGGYVGVGDPGDTGSVATVFTRGTNFCRIISASNSTVTLERLTISGGYVNDDSGGGIVSIGGALCLTNCVLSNNCVNITTIVGSRHGGAVYKNDGLLVLQDCVLVTNRIQGGSQSRVYGGGVACLLATCQVSNCRFDANSIQRNGYPWGTASAWGGALYLSNGVTSVSNSLFTRNFIFNVKSGSPSADEASCGGGLCATNYGHLYIQDCTFTSNYVYHSISDTYEKGGALYLETEGAGSSVIQGCRFLNNGRTNEAGDVCLNGGPVCMSNNIVAGAVGHRSGLEVDNGSVDVINGTAANNSDWGMECSQGALRVTNGIAWGNVAGGIKVRTGVTVAYSCSQESQTGTGNITADPLFVNAANRDYHLKSSEGRWTVAGWTNDSVDSPCIDAGDPASDFSLEPKPDGGRINMGAYGNTRQASKGKMIVVTLPASDIETNSVTLNGDLVSVHEVATTVTLYWGPSDGTTNASAWSNAIGMGVLAKGAFSTNISGLGMGTGFWYRCFASNSAATAWAVSSESFLPGAPTVINIGASNLSLHSADLLGSLVKAGIDWPEVRVYYGTNDGQTVRQNWQTNVSFGVQDAGSLTTNAAGLLDGTLYYYRFYATNGAGEDWAPASASFTTTPDYSSRQFYVKPGGTGNGKDWDRAFGDVQDVVRTYATNAGSVVYMKCGAYFISSPVVITNAPGLVLKGGYAGSGSPGDTTNAPSVLTQNGNDIRLMSIHSSTAGLERITFTGGRCVSIQGQSIYGGGLYATNSALSISNCAFCSNTIPLSTPWNRGYGGGLYACASRMTVEDSRFEANEVAGIIPTPMFVFGGALYADGGSLMLRNCRFAFNQVTTLYTPYAVQGGAIGFAGVTNGTIRNCLLIGNHAVGAGAALYGSGQSGYAPVTIENCTIADNLGPSAVYLSSANADFRNCILWDNGDDLAGNGGRVTLLNCCIQEGQGNCTAVNTMVLDPRFEQGYYLASNSPCIDAGNTNVAAVGLGDCTTRTDGGPDTGMVDIGYHAASGTPVSGDLFVNAATGNDGNEGTSWEQAFKTATKALDAASNGSVRIHVAAGVLSRATGETFPLQMKTGVAILGAGSSATGTVFDAGMSNRILNVSNCLHGTRIENVRIQKGKDSSAEGKGGGVKADLSFLAVSNCTFFNNAVLATGSSSVYGGGVCGWQSVLTIDGTTFESNSSRNVVSGYSYGGGLAAQGGRLIARDCRFVGNEATNSSGYGYGGGVYAAGGWTGHVVSACLMASNLAAYGGGGLYLDSAATAERCVIMRNCAQYGGGANGGTIRNCLIYTNAGIRGGGAYEGTIQNCTIAGNSAQYGGGIYQWQGSVRSSVVYFNSATVSDTNSFGTNLSYCCTTPLPTNGINIVTDPQFVDATASNYRLKMTSPCIDSGANQDWMNGATDMDGYSRMINGKVDIGVYETPFYTSLRVWLQGGYDAGQDKMTTGLRDTMPLTSPYKADPRGVTAIPSNVTDWVLVQLRETNGNAIVSRSAFVNQDGYVLADNGSTGLVVDVSPGTDCYLVLQHRNHLAVMTAVSVGFTNILTAWDFTTNASCYYGGSTAAVEMEPGAWGMIAGDADGDGKITETDRKIVEQQKGRSGYLPGDLNLDGQVE